MSTIKNNNGNNVNKNNVNNNGKKAKKGVKVMETNKVIENAKKRIEAAKNGQNDVKKAHSFQFYVRALKSLSKKNEFCNNKNVRETENNLPNGFSLSYFYKDFAGRWCAVKSYNGAISFETVKDASLHGETITDKGKELILSKDGANIMYLCPIALNITAVFNAFANIVKATAKAEIKDEKGRIKAANLAAKTLNKKQREMQTALNKAAKDLANNVISLDEFNSIYNETQKVLLYA